MIHNGAVSWTRKSVWKSNFFFLYMGKDLKMLRKPILLRCMCFCTGYRAVGRTQTEKLDPIYFMEELSKWCYFPLYMLWLFSVSHTALCMRSSNIYFFVWPDVVYLNFMYRNDLVTCEVQQSHNEGNRYWLLLLHVQMLSLNNYRGNIFLYF